MASMSTLGSYHPLTAPVRAPSKPKAQHHWYDGVTGFVGHLTSDIKNAATGLPMGIVQMVTHPVASGELMAKTTWQDWSPLFHGDFDKWKHQTFEHPLAPILDIASVLTGGAAISARVAGGVAEVGAATAASEEAANAFKTGALARYANPAKAALARHIIDIHAENIRLGRFPMSNSTAIERAGERLATDPSVHRVVETPGGVKATARYSNNPWHRVRSKAIIKAANSPVAKQIGITEQLGDAAFAKKWLSMEKSRRAHATPVLIQRQLTVLHKAGEILDTLHLHTIFDMISPTMREGLETQALRVPLREAGSDADHALQGQDKLQYVLDRDLVGETPVYNALNRTRSASNRALNRRQRFEAGLNKWGDAHTTKNPLLAQKTPDGKYLLAVADRGKMGHEALNTSRTLDLLYKKPTTMWKFMVLAASPRYMVNNVVGNTLMLGMSADPVSMSQAIYNHIRIVRGAKAADKAYIEAARVAHGPNSIVEATYRAKRQAEGLTPNEKSLAAEHYGLAKSSAGGLSGIKGGLYGITHKLSDTFHRDVAMNTNLARTPEFQAYYSDLTKKGVTGYERQVQASHLAYSHASVRNFVRENVNHTLGQYHHFTGFEKTIKGVVPFYAWDRAITRHTVEMVRSKPYQAAMLAAIGQRGHEANQTILGNMPDFIQNVVPASALTAMGGPAGFLTHLITGGESKGRKGVLLTQGLNPYSTLADLTSSAEAAVGGKVRMGDSLGAQLNPVLAGAAETISGTSLMTGAPVHPVGGIMNVYLGQAVNMPQTKIVELLLQKYRGQGYAQPAKTPSGKPGKPFLYQKNLYPQVAGILGAPTRQLSETAAQSLYNKQQGIKTGRKRKVGLAPLNQVEGHIPGL